MAFVKVHDHIFQSSIIEEDVVTRWVWICLLLSCDKNGNIYGTDKALARKTNVSIQNFEASLEILAAPDPGSTSQEEEGRRITRAGPNLYHCVNYLHYRGLKDPVEERAKTRERVAKHRANKCNAGNKNVTKSNDIAYAEAYADADAETSPPSPSSRKQFKKPTRPELVEYCTEKRLEKVDVDVFIDHYEANGWMIGKGKMKDWQAAIRNWDRRDSKESGKKRNPTSNHSTAQDGGEWMYGCYRSADDQAHSDKPEWLEYTEYAVECEPETAMTFEEWMEVR